MYCLYVPPVMGAWESLAHPSRGCDEIERMYRELKFDINTPLSAMYENWQLIQRQDIWNSPQ